MLAPVSRAYLLTFMLLPSSRQFRASIVVFIVSSLHTCTYTRNRLHGVQDPNAVAISSAAVSSQYAPKAISDTTVYCSSKPTLAFLTSRYCSIVTLSVDGTAVELFNVTQSADT